MVESLNSWANAITAMRILLAPLVFLAIPEDGSGSWWAFLLWFVLCSSDGVDGYIARRRGPTTVGAFLDPLADKVLVLGAMFTLVAHDVFWWVPVAIIAAREVGDQCLSDRQERAGRERAREQARQVQDRGPAVRRGVRPVPTDCAGGDVDVAAAAVARRRAHRGERGPVLLVRDEPAACRRGRAGLVNVSVLAVGTELLLGQIIDSNSAWMGEELAVHGIDSLVQVKVGDNVARIEGQLRRLLDDADAVIVCGGLGPTHDDLTREAIAAVMGTMLTLDDSVARVIRDMFESRGRRMPENNLRQAMVPVGAAVIPQTRGTAPGLICPIGGPDGKVVYAVPGVPHEMRDMVQRAIVPDLVRRSGSNDTTVSRVLRTWGESESGLNERLDDVIAELDSVGTPTLAFLASDGRA